MSSGDLCDIIWLPGRLVKDPTDLNAAYPYGGTELGLSVDVMVALNQNTTRIRAEEWGPVIHKVFDGGRDYVLGANLRGSDNDALSTIFRGANTGGTSGNVGIVETVTSPRAGREVTYVKLLHVPDDPLYHKATLLYAAAPLVEETAELQMNRVNEFLTPVLFQVTPDSTGRLYAHQLLVDMTL